MRLKVVVVLLAIALAFVTVHADWYPGSHGVIHGGAILDHWNPYPYFYRGYYGPRYYGPRYHGRRYYGRRRYPSRGFWNRRRRPRGG